jgi:hypothetical protein
MTDVWLAELIGSPVGSFQGLLHTQQSWWEILFKNCPVSRGKGPFRLVRGGGDQRYSRHRSLSRECSRERWTCLSRVFSG